VILLLALSADAHRLDPGVLALREVNAGQYIVRWQPPEAAPAATRPTIDCVRRETLWDCGADGPGSIEAPDGALVVVSRLGGEQVVYSLTPARPRWSAAETPGPASWLPMGLRHALTGADHLLFVAGLVVLIDRLRPLLVAITAFTIAHSITLAAAALGVLTLPQAPVEACIALSLVLLAVELTRPEPTGPAWRLAGGFGLLHGLGFAGALAGVGLPAGQQAPALLGFNIGVELAQLLVVAAMILPARWLRRRGWQAATAYVIGPLGVAWMIDRIAGF
jgi:hydrogenase/urease accessory protein HupE